MNSNRRAVAKGLAGLALSSALPVGLAQSDFPSKSIRLVVGYPPGGANDITARQVAQRLTEVLKVSVVVDNRAGANGLIGSDLVAKATPDGYTLLMGGLTPMVLNRLTYTKLPYNPDADLVGVSTVASSPIVFAVRPSLPVNNLADLVRLAKSKPDAVRFATVGSGGSTRVVLEFLNQATGAGITYIPYKGAAPAITDILGGSVDGMGVDLPALLPFIKDGRLRGIAITSETRNSLLPELRTAAEQGVPELTCGNWYAVVAPARTPRAVLQRLHVALQQVVALPDFRQQTIAGGAEPRASASIEAFASFQQSELARWGKVIKIPGIEAE